MMRASLQAALLALVVTGCAPSAPAPNLHPASETLAPAQLAEELAAMAAVDQTLRTEAVAAMRATPQDTAQLRELAVRMDSLSRAQVARLQAFIRAHGWPEPEAIGSEASEALFLIVQHADHNPAFQEEYLAVLQRAFARGQVGGEALALLTDRVRVGQGRPQRYGTQVSLDGGVIRFHPMEDEEGVDARRAELGLPPLAEYLKMLERAYGTPP